MGADDKVERRLRDSLIYGHGITELPEPAPLIYDLLPLDAAAVLFGPSGSGKSLVALDWALHVASGLDWWGRPTVHGPVLYVVAEGARGTKHRYEAWCEYHSVSQVDQITWMTAPANVLQSVEREVLLSIVEETRPILTVLDTLARHIPGGDENSFETMSVLVETLDGIKRLTGGTALGVHHSGKDEEKGGRGHSSLKGALDAELVVRAYRDHGLRVKVRAEKYKDWEDHRDLYMARMETVGKSLVPVPEDELRDAERVALKALEEHGSMPWSVWLSTSGLARSTFYRAQQRLEELGLAAHDEVSLMWHTT